MDKEFFTRDAEIVAKELLGKILIRQVGGGKRNARIVETEAYFDDSDPASRACQKGDLQDTMKMDAGTILIYGIHNNWLMNFVTGSEGKASAVLIRALEPLNFEGKCSGPGLLTKALQIDKSFHKQNIFDNEELTILNNNKINNFEIVEAFRIGVRKDLPKKLRFYIKDNEYVSRNKLSFPRKSRRFSGPRKP